MESSLDELTLKVDKLLCTLKVDELKIIATLLNVKNEAEKEESIVILKRIVVKAYEHIYDDADRTLEDKKKLFMDMIEAINSFKDKDEVAGDKEKAAVVEDQVPVVDAEEEEVNADSTTTKMLLKKPTSGKRDTFNSYESLLKKTSLLRKELKLRGQIGEPSQKDKLSYVSLMHQIEEAKSSGYDDDEIVSAVIKAMTPNLTLRNVLESLKDLTIQRLYQFLEAHYDEKNASELCSKLSSLVQLPEESPYLFVMRCIEVRQKLLIASLKSDIPYDEKLVMKLFNRTIENGLSSSYVLQEIKPLLRQDAVSDEGLIAAVSKAHSAEKERASAQSRPKAKSVKVVKFEAEPQKSDDRVDKLLSVVENLTQQVSGLQSQVSKLTPKSDGLTYSANCEICAADGLNYCRHCYKCGSLGHIARNCTVKKSN